MRTPFLLTLAVFLFPAQLLAQEPAPAPAAPPTDTDGDLSHDGFFFRLGLNVGPLITSTSLDPAPANAEDVKYSGLHLGSDLMFGGTPAKGLVIGGFAMYNQTSDPTVKQGSAELNADGTLFFLGLGAFANYYLDPKSGLHFQALFGFSGIDFVSASGSSGGNDPVGFMLGVGAGYDFFFANEWSVGPFARLIYSSMSADAGAGSLKASYLYPSLGVAITLH
jgi:outer membrane autotransporter protein